MKDPADIIRGLLFTALIAFFLVLIASPAILFIFFVLSLMVHSWNPLIFVFGHLARVLMVLIVLSAIYFIDSLFE